MVVVCGVQFSNHVVGVSLLFSSPDVTTLSRHHKKLQAHSVSRSHIAIFRHQKMFAFVAPHSETQSVVTQLWHPMAWNCWRLATATSIFCSIAGAFVTQCRLFVIRHNDAVSFANWYSWSFCQRKRGVGDNQCFDFVGKAQKG